MKKGNYIRISKLKAVGNPIFSTPNKKDYIPGQDNGPVSLPIDYAVEGYLLADVKLNQSILIDRRKRNDVKTPGFMRTSFVQSIHKNIVKTDNSVYKIEVIKT